MNLRYYIRNLFLNRYFQHIIFWLFYFLLWSITFANLYYSSETFIKSYLRACGEIISVMPVRILATYFTLYLLDWKEFISGNFAKTILVFLVSVAFFGLLHRLSDYYLATQFSTNKEIAFFHISQIIRDLVNTYSIVAVAATFKLIRQWHKSQQNSSRLEREKLQAELSLLKTQIHPHFLFNTLNNLYALTLKKSDTAPEIVLRISELLSYVLYECNADRVCLEKEIGLLNNYIALEQIRYGKRLQIDYKIKGEVSGKIIAPMLLLPFVENGFKHGVSGEINEPWIKIYVNVEAETLHLYVENSKSEVTARDSHRYKEGIGIANVKKRLNLAYSNRFTLKIEDKGVSFCVNFKLQLT